jgi:PhzF family phenazine biosynthesis protein
VKEDAGYHLRWFTPGTEVELCGHATLASSFVILNFYEPGSNSVQFKILGQGFSVIQSPRGIALFSIVL